MNTPVLNDNLRAATEALCNLLAKEDKVVASKAKIGLFFQNPEVKEVVFSGELRRFDSFSDILRLIEKTSDVKFTTTGNTVLVRE